MKKLVVMLAMVLAAVMANAASVKWSGSNVFSSDGVNKVAVGTSVELYAALVSDGVAGDYSKVDTKAVASAGIIGQTVAIDSMSAGQVYNFYYVFTDNGKTFTSAVKANVTIAAVGNTNVAFGNQQSATQDPSNWGGGDAPEPTSGLLLLIGGAMLALRRKQK